MALYEYIADGGLYDSYGGLLLFSGEATVTTRYVHRPTVSGGLTTGGSVSTVRTRIYIASSGFSTGRGATVRITKVYTATSGLTSGGSAGVARARLYTGAGDLVTDGVGTTVQAHSNDWESIGFLFIASGHASLTKTKVYTASGGLTSGDTGSHSYTRLATLVEDGGTFGGAATTGQDVQYVYVASGDLTTGDSASVLVTKAYAGGSAGLSLGGSATVTTTVVTIKTYVASAGLSLAGSATLARTIVVIRTYAASAGLSSSGSATTTAVPVVYYPYISLGRVGVFAGSVSVKRTKTYSSSSGSVLGGLALTSKAHFATYISTGSISLAGTCTSARGNDFLIIAELFSATYYPRVISLPTRTLHIAGHTKLYVSMTGKEFGFCLRAYPGLRVRAHAQVLDRVYIPSGGIDMDGSDCA